MEKTLVVSPAWVGDMVMSHTLVDVLRARHDGDVEIHCLAPPASAPLGQRMPGVAATHVLDVGHGRLDWSARRHLGRALRAEAFDHAIVLPNTLKSALVPLWAGIPRRTGFTGESRYGLLNDRRELDPARLPLMIERFMALGLDPGAPLPATYPRPRLEAERGRASELAAGHGLDAARPLTALCPGAEYGPAKRWPARHFVRVARHLVARGGQVCLIGGPGDAAVAAEIVALLDADPSVVDLTGRTTLLEAVDLLALASDVVCNDSGLMHVACAVGTRVVALYGSTSPGFTPPLSERAEILMEPQPCSPCFERECPLGHMRCLNELAPERVIARLEAR